MSWRIQRNPWPPPPEPHYYKIPIPPNLKAEGGAALENWKRKTRDEQEALFMEKWNAYVESRSKQEAEGTAQYEVYPEIHFPDRIWKGGDIGAGLDAKEMFLGEIDRYQDLILPGGRTIQGRIEDVSDEKVIANKARLDMEAANAVPAPPKPSPNPKGRKPKYDAAEDAKICDRWEKAQTMGRVPAKKFLEENPDIFKNNSLKARAIKLTQLKDRVRSRKKKALRKK